MLNNNNLRGPIPASIGQLGELRSLRLSFNSMDSSLPAELGDLSRLVYLALNNNQFTGRSTDRVLLCGGPHSSLQGQSRQVLGS